LVIPPANETAKLPELFHVAPAATVTNPVNVGVPAANTKLPLVPPPTVVVPVTPKVKAPSVRVELFAIDKLVATETAPVVVALVPPLIVKFPNVAAATLWVVPLYTTVLVAPIVPNVGGVLLVMVKVAALETSIEGVLSAPVAGMVKLHAFVPSPTTTFDPEPETVQPDELIVGVALFLIFHIVFVVVNTVGEVPEPSVLGPQLLATSRLPVDLE